MKQIMGRLYHIAAIGTIGNWWENNMKQIIATWWENNMKHIIASCGKII